MSNARDTETNPLTPEQKQRAEALRIAASILSDRGPFTAGSLPGGRTPDDVITLADFILEAAFVGEAPEPDAGDASATEKATECQWPGCWTGVDQVPQTLTVHYHTFADLQPACAAHAGRSLFRRTT